MISIATMDNRIIKIMTNPKPKLVTVKKSVKHIFTPDETAALNKDFGAAYDAVVAAEADLKSVQASYKSKVTEAEARMTSLRATINAGFEHRDKECVIVFRADDRKKDFYFREQIGEDGSPTLGEMPVLTEVMTAEDFEQDLIQAESAFENRVELYLWDAGPDSCRLIVGRQNGKWFTALRGSVGEHSIEERLDGEQPATKKRFDAITRAGKRIGDWLRANLGKEEAKGFEDEIIAVIDGEKDKVE